MLHDGFAAEYTYDLPYRYQADFQAAETDARSRSRGLWAASTCSGELDRPAEPTPAPPGPDRRPLDGGAA